MMNAYSAMQLIVQADFFVGFVVVAGKLDAIHTKIALHQRIRSSLAENLGERNKWATVVGPGDQLWELVDSCRIALNRTGPNAFREHGPCRPGCSRVSPRSLKELVGVDF